MELLTWSEVCETLCFLYFAGIRELQVNYPIDQHYRQIVFQPLQSNILFFPWNFHNLWLIQSRLYRVSQLVTRKSEIYKPMVIFWWQEKFEIFNLTLSIFIRNRKNTKIVVEHWVTYIYEIIVKYANEWYDYIRCGCIYYCLYIRSLLMSNCVLIVFK